MSHRTTLTLEDDVAAGLEAEVRRTGRSFKDVVNEAIRTGIDHRNIAPTTRFVVRARDMGAKPGVDFDDIEGLLDRIEGPSRR